MEKDKLITYIVSAVVTVAITLILLFTAGFDNWLFWILAGVGSGAITLLLANVAIGYFSSDEK